jgi:sec-independent protein translocase protein TatA
MPFGVGWPELIILLVIVLVIFGASRVPEVGRSLGKGIKEFRSSVTEAGKDESKAKAESKDEEPAAKA